MNRLNPLYILLSIIIINILTYAFLEDKKDSFNPIGTTNVGAALGLGILNFLLEKN